MFSAVSASALLDSTASSNFIAMPQVTNPVIIFRNPCCDLLRLWKCIWLIIPFQYADGAIYTVDFWVAPALNHATIMGMSFLHTLNLSIDWKTHTVTWYHPKLTFILPPSDPIAPSY